ncbi:8237_t:CDS:10 [Diversispora eburnea]|uniref:Anaphase-promoting complex subunit 5 n=1 Tax=Diversispora eburnea TaxID=1213867 RepID=A0A9N9AJ31_9GLOM|nr:8237_t:CDS:10 [Diversispora eburnea]
MDIEKETYISKTTVLTPHKISLLTLVYAYTDIEGERDMMESLLYFLIEKISNEHRFPEPTLPELCDEIFQKTKAALLMHVLLDSGKYSLLGIFVRRCQIEGEKLEFDEICRLYNAMVKYKAPTPELYEKIKELEDLDLELDYESGVLSQIAQHYHMHNQGEYEGALTNFYKYSNFCPNDAENRRSWYQYVLLNLVVLHSKFGHKEQALLVIREAIEMARENNDQDCLRFALSWLYRLKSSDHTLVDVTDQQMLESLIIKAKQSNYTSLQSLASPTKVFDSLFKSSVLNLNCPFKTMRYQGQLLYANVWQIYGSSALSALYSYEVLSNPEPSLEDLVIAYSFDLLAESKSKFIGIRRAALQWIVCLERILDEFANVEALETQLRGSCQDDEFMRADFDYNRALYLAKIGRPEEATDVLQGLINKSSRLGSRNQMLEAENPTTALPYVLSSLCISERFHYQSSYLMAIIRLSQILIHFDLIDRAKAMIENIMPMVLTEHSLYMQSISHLIYAQCLIAHRKQSIKWEEVLESLNNAQWGFSHLESLSQLLDVIQLKSYVYNVTGDFVKPTLLGYSLLR